MLSTCQPDLCLSSQITPKPRGSHLTRQSPAFTINPGDNLWARLPPSRLGYVTDSAVFVSRHLVQFCFMLLSWPFFSPPHLLLLPASQKKWDGTCTMQPTEAKPAFQRLVGRG